VAIGNPFGFTHTVTSGVISAVNRDLEVNDGKAFHNLIQTDASINPGNSGGPLLNILGELIGINTAIRGDAENMAFAISVDNLLDELPEMLNIEHLRRVRLGMRVGGRDEARVTEVSADSPAAAAGIRVRDIVTAVDGQSVKRDTDFYFALLEKDPDRPIHISVVRNGKPKDVELTIREIPRPNGAALAKQLFGLHLRELTPRQCRRLGLKPGVGLLVVEVEEGSPAAEIGVVPGDIVSSLGRYYVSSLDSVGQLLQYVDEGDEVRFGGLRIERNDLYRLQGTLPAR
jgi:serine protease Do